MALLSISTLVLLIQACPIVTNFPNGSVTARETNATFSCNKYYHLVPAEQETVQCLESGYWESAIPTCKLSSCSGTWTCSDTSFCHERVFRGVENVPGCFKSPCPPPQIPNGKYSLTYDTALMSCHNYYYLKGASYLNCVSDKDGIMRWDQAYPKCIRHTCATWPCPRDHFCVDSGDYLYCHRKCPVLGPVEHGTIENFQSYANLSCDQFYYTAHNYVKGERGDSWASIMCRVDGTWELTGEPRCEPHTCQTYKCEETSFKFSYFHDFNRTFCFKNSEGYPTCGVACVEPDPKPYLVQKMHLYTYPSNGSFSCSNQYYYLQGHPFLECQVLGWGSWQTPSKELARPNEFRCLPHSCFTWTKCGVGQWCEMVGERPACFGPCPTPSIHNGFVTVNKQFAEFHCNQYYYLEGPSTITCNTDLQWENDRTQSCVKHTCDTWKCWEGTYCVWKNDFPHCWPACPTPDTIPLGTVQFGDSYAEYTCDSDLYKIEGVSTLICTSEGTWNDPPPTCVPHDCSSWQCGAEEYCLVDQEGFPACYPGCPPLSPDSSPSPTHTLSCDDQYHYLDGPETLTCNPDGQWNSEPSSCVAHTCDTWPCSDTEYCLMEGGIPVCYPACKKYWMIHNGWVTWGKRTVQFSCNTYFTIEGSATLSCLKNGQWDAPKPSCAPHDCSTWQCETEQYCVMEDGIPACYPKCPELSDIPNGAVSLTPALATFTCTSTYFYIPSDQDSSLRCSADGRWSGEPPQCLPHTCVTWSCDSGEFCKLDENDKPSCVPGCPKLGEVTNGTVSQTDESAIISCEKNFYVNGTGVLHCEDGGTWSGDLPECLPHTCVTISCSEDQFCSLVNDFPICQLACNSSFSDSDPLLKITSNNTHAIFKCPPLHKEYILWGYSILNCLPSGQWDNDPPVCRKTWCLDLNCADQEYCFAFEEIKNCYPKCPKIELADYNYEETKMPSFTYWFYESSVRETYLTADMACSPYYYLSVNNRALTCQTNGTWDLDPLPHCIPHTCDTWPNCADDEKCIMENGLPSCVYGDCSAVTCAVDEFCTFETIASENVAVCKKSCPVLNSPVNGAVESSNLFAKFTCKEKYYLVGDSTLRCVEGNWDRTAPTCKAYTCTDWECELDEYCFHFLGIPVCQTSCPDLTPPTHGTVEQTDTSATFSCDKFYQLYGRRELSCQTNGYWDGAAPTCKPYDCSTWTCEQSHYCILIDNLPACYKSCPVLSGNEEKSLTLVQNDTTAIFECLSVYKYLQGRRTLTCTFSGTWDGDAPTCVTHTCKTWNCDDPLVGEPGDRCGWDFGVKGPACYWAAPLLPPPENGKVVVEKQLTVFSCNYRYILNGEKALTYNHTSEKWSAPPPTCVPLTCAQWSCSDTQYCSLVDNLPYCKLSCPDIASMNNGYVSIVGGIATFSCLEYFYMEGPDKLFCVEGSWAGDAPTCKPHSCTTFLCEEGHYCTLQSGVPICLLKCPDLHLTNGTVTIHNGVASFTCSHYFFLSGESRLTCYNGTWGGSEPRCTPHICTTYSCHATEFCEMEEGLPRCLQGCQDVLTLNNGSVQQTMIRADFVCNDMFYLEGPSSVQCVHGEWAEDLPQCVPHSCISWNCGENTFCAMVNDMPTCQQVCPGLPPPEDGTIEQHYTTARFSCISLYRLEGRSVLNCVEGAWDGTPPLCVPQTCQYFSCPEGNFCDETEEFGGLPACYLDCPYPEIYNGNITRSGSFATIVCLEGFKLVGRETIQCLEGEWDPAPPSCTPTSCELVESCEEEHSCRMINGLAICSPDCPMLDFPNGQITVSNFVATFACNTGYKMRGTTRQLNCRTDGSWDYTPPYCVQPLFEFHRHQLAVCFASISSVSQCDDVISAVRAELEDDQWALSLLVGVVKDTVYNGTRHNYVLGKLLLREIQPHEGSFTDDLRSTIKNIAADNAEYLTRLEEDVQPAAVRKLIAMTMRIVNSLIRSIQLDNNSRRTDFDTNRWRERGRANAGPDQDIFSMSPHSDFMKSLKIIGEDLVNQLKVSGT
ncbi:hypothetical protein ACHWQZ_G001072 [Mnemiopsis leidyi]